ncbi:MAG: hypothetical protein EA415_11895 [Sphaerobacteraceae bacterium]|nr:MAG: hypothetical protein EA415_11895 [Sphaerobacteraceae bacterium]
MRIDTNRTVHEFRQRIETDARLEFGDERAGELSEQLDHLANMLAGVARQSLDLRDEPLPSGPVADRRGDV